MSVAGPMHMGLPHLLVLAAAVKKKAVRTSPRPTTNMAAVMRMVVGDGRPEMAPTGAGGRLHA